MFKKGAEKKRRFAQIALDLSMIAVAELKPIDPKDESARNAILMFVAAKAVIAAAGLSP